MTIVLTGCAGKPLDTRIIDKHQKTWRIASANTHYKDGTIKVSGYMQPLRRFTNPKGHIDITVINSTGKVLLKETATLSKGIMRNGGNYFSLTHSIAHKKNFPDNVIIMVEYTPQNNNVNDSYKSRPNNDELSTISKHIK